MIAKIRGLVAAVHTPFAVDGKLNLAAVERQAEHLQRAGVAGVFVGGTTGECASLTVDERRALAQRWSEVVRATNLRLIVHVGSNCLADARELARHAEAVGADGIAAVAPCYFKPASVDALVACCADVAAAAPATPFYYYDIPVLTGIQLPAAEFLAAAAERIPTLAGVKFTNPNLAGFLRCLDACERRFDPLWGIDEQLLAALGVGAIGAVGSSYNFAAPIYVRLITAFERGELEAARAEQLRAVQLIDLLAGYGYMAAAKATMGFLGVEVGPPRLPITCLAPVQIDKLQVQLERHGFFEWLT